MIACAAIAATPQDDLPDFSMRGVTIKMKNGRQISGYVIYDPNIPGNVQFPQCLIDPNIGYPELTVYRELYPVAKALGFAEKRFVTTESQRVVVQTDQIARIIAVPGPHDGHVSHWEPPLFHSSEVVRWLTGEKPQAVLNGVAPVAGMLISYNRDIGEKDLHQINGQFLKIEQKYLSVSWSNVEDEEKAMKALAKEWDDFTRQLERRRVALLVYCENDCC
jgi:hypothetical protein